MQQNGLYWALFAPMIKSSIRNRYGKDLAERAIKNGKAEYRTLVSEAPELGRGNLMASNAYFAYVFVGACGEMQGLSQFYHHRIRIGRSKNANLLLKCFMVRPGEF